MDNISDAQLSFDFGNSENDKKDNVFYIDFSNKKNISFLDQNSEIINEILEEAKKIKWD